MLLFGAAAQFGIFFAVVSSVIRFDIRSCFNRYYRGAADRPTSIFVANQLVH